MKKLLMAAVAMAALNAVPAMAADGDFAVTGTVNAACSAVGTGTVAFGTIATSAATGKITGQNASSGANTVWCNGTAAKLSFVGANTNTIATTTINPDATNFTNSLTYVPTVTVNGANVPTTTNIGIVYGALVVSAALNAGANTKIPVAGDYTGTITVTLAPAG